MLPKTLLLLVLPAVLAAPVDLNAHPEPSLQPRALPWGMPMRPYRDAPVDGPNKLPAVRPRPAPAPVPAAPPPPPASKPAPQPAAAPVKVDKPGRTSQGQADVFRVSEGNSVALFNGKPVDLASGKLIVKNINEKRSVEPRDLRRKLGLDFLSNPDNNEEAMQQHLRDPTVGAFVIPASNRRPIDYNSYGGQPPYPGQQPYPQQPYGAPPQPYAPPPQWAPYPDAAPMQPAHQPVMKAAAPAPPSAVDEVLEDVADEQELPAAQPWKGKAITVFNGQPVQAGARKALAMMSEPTLAKRDVRDRLGLNLFSVPKNSGRRKTAAEEPVAAAAEQESHDDAPADAEAASAPRDHAAEADAVYNAAAVEHVPAPKPISKPQPIPRPAPPAVVHSHVTTHSEDDAALNELANGKSFVIYNGVPVEVSDGEARGKTVRPKKPRPAFRREHELVKRAAVAGKKIPGINPFATNPITGAPRHPQPQPEGMKKSQTSNGHTKSDTVMRDAKVVHQPESCEEERVRVNKGKDYVVYNGEQVGVNGVEGVGGVRKVDGRMGGMGMEGLMGWNLKGGIRGLEN